MRTQKIGLRPGDSGVLGVRKNYNQLYPHNRKEEGIGNTFYQSYEYLQCAGLLELPDAGLYDLGRIRRRGCVKSEPKESFSDHVDQTRVPDLHG